MRLSTVFIAIAAVWMLTSANTQSTVSSAASQSQAIAKSAIGTITTTVQKEGQDALKIVQAVLKQVLGDANYQKLMALIGNLVKKIQAAVAGLKKQAASAVAGLSGKSAKPFVDLWEELNTSPIMRSPTQNTVSNAASQGAAIAKSALGTVSKDAQKELQDVVKIAQAVLKQILGDGNYQKLEAMLKKLVAAIQAAVKKLQTQVQGAVGGIKKALSGKAILQELSTQSTIQGAAKAGLATAQSGAKTLAADAQKELNLVVKVLEAILKQILGEANYKQLMAMINQLVGAAKNAAGQVVKGAQGIAAGIQKTLGGAPKNVFAFEQELNTSPIMRSVTQGAAVAKSAAGTVVAAGQKELNLVIKVLEAVLKQILGEANYKQLMAMINQLIAQAKAAAAKAQAAAGQAVKQLQGAIAGIQKQLGGAPKNMFAFEQELNTSPIMRSVTQGTTVAKSAAGTVVATAQKEANLLIKVLEAVLKQILGDANYKQLMAIVNQLIAQAKAAAAKAQAAAGQAVKQLQGAIAGIQKQMGGSKPVWDDIVEDFEF